MDLINSTFKMMTNWQLEPINMDRHRKSLMQNNPRTYTHRFCPTTSTTTQHVVQTLQT